MKLGMKITAITSTDLEGFRVGLRFADGKSGTVSLNNIFSPPRNLSAEVLKGGMFAKCFVENGALAWPNGLELCPDAVYSWMEQEQSQAVGD